MIESLKSGKDNELIVISCIRLWDITVERLVLISRSL
jgi:hypothetical protein